LEHPYIHPIIEINYHREKQKIVIFRDICVRGSLRDLIYKAKPFKKSFQENYVIAKGGQDAIGYPLSESDIKK